MSIGFLYRKPPPATELTSAWWGRLFACWLVSGAVSTFVHSYDMLFTFSLWAFLCVGFFPIRWGLPTRT